MDNPFTNQLLYIKKNVINVLLRNANADPFKVPVNPELLQIPQYPRIIKSPMDFGTIKTKLDKRIYPNANECKNDFMDVFRNCYIFNEPGSMYVEMALKLENLYHRKMSELPVPEVYVNDATLTLKSSSKIKKSSKSHGISNVNKNSSHHHHNQNLHHQAQSQLPFHTLSQPQPSFTSTPNITSHKRPRVPSLVCINATTPLSEEPSIKKSKHTSIDIKTLKQILQNLMSKKYSDLNRYFLQPVDVEGLKLHDYYDIVKKPMDLGTVRTKLLENRYQANAEFADDVRLIFHNCYLYNPEGHEVHRCGKLLEGVFNKLYHNSFGTGLTSTSNNNGEIKGTVNSVGKTITNSKLSNRASGPNYEEFEPIVQKIVNRQNEIDIIHRDMLKHYEEIQQAISYINRSQLIQTLKKLDQNTFLQSAIDNRIIQNNEKLKCIDNGNNLNNNVNTSNINTLQHNPTPVQSFSTCPSSSSNNISRKSSTHSLPNETISAINNSVSTNVKGELSESPEHLLKSEQYLKSSDTELVDTIDNKPIMIQKSPEENAFRSRSNSRTPVNSPQFPTSIPIDNSNSESNIPKNSETTVNSAPPSCENHSTKSGSGDNIELDFEAGTSSVTSTAITVTTAAAEGMNSTAVDVAVKDIATISTEHVINESTNTASKKAPVDPVILQSNTVTACTLSNKEKPPTSLLQNSKEISQCLNEISSWMSRLSPEMSMKMREFINKSEKKIVISVNLLNLKPATIKGLYKLMLKSKEYSDTIEANLKHFTNEERIQLSRDLRKVGDRYSMKILKIYKTTEDVDSSDGECELDFQKMKLITLHRLREFADKCIQKRQDKSTVNTTTTSTNSVNGEADDDESESDSSDSSGSNVNSDSNSDSSSSSSSDNEFVVGDNEQKHKGRSINTNNNSSSTNNSSNDALQKPGTTTHTASNSSVMQDKITPVEPSTSELLVSDSTTPLTSNITTATNNNDITNSCIKSTNNSIKSSLSKQPKTFHNKPSALLTKFSSKSDSITSNTASEFINERRNKSRRLSDSESESDSEDASTERVSSSGNGVACTKRPKYTNLWNKSAAKDSRKLDNNSSKVISTDSASVSSSMNQLSQQQSNNSNIGGNTQISGLGLKSDSSHHRRAQTQHHQGSNKNPPAQNKLHESLKQIFQDAQAHENVKKQEEELRQCRLREEEELKKQQMMKMHALTESRKRQQHSEDQKKIYEKTKKEERIKLDKKQRHMDIPLAPEREDYHQMVCDFEFCMDRDLLMKLVHLDSKQVNI